MKNLLLPSVFFILSIGNVFGSDCGSLIKTLKESIEGNLSYQQTDWCDGPCAEDAEEKSSRKLKQIQNRAKGALPYINLLMKIEKGDFTHDDVKLGLGSASYFDSINSYVRNGGSLCLPSSAFTDLLINQNKKVNQIYRKTIENLPEYASESRENKTYEKYFKEIENTSEVKTLDLRARALGLENSHSLFEVDGDYTDEQHNNISSKMVLRVLTRNELKRLIKK